jgi:hypothetical protein
MLGTLTALVWLAASPGAAPAGPPTKVPPAVAQEMSEAVVAVNKALGLESWPQHGAQPCVDRGGEGTMGKDVTAADTRRCASEALATGFPQLGKAYALAILMTSVGPSTIIAVGMAEAAGFAAYSCDPGRKCPPTKIQATTKWGKRVLERQQKACGAPDTVWLPAEMRACPAAP